MARFFVTGAPQGRTFLGGDEGRHGARVLRLRPGEPVTLCDGQGTDYPATVESVQPDGLWLDVAAPVPNRAEPRTQVIVCQCLPKGDKLETVVQKSVELGAAAIWPLESQRCVARPDPKRAAQKTARLQRVALEAAKQSGRGIVPTVCPPQPLARALKAAAAAGTVLFFYEKGTHTLRKALQGPAPYFIFIGPEGGFTPEECALAQAAGALPLTLGPRILRTETAPLAALSALLFAKDEFSV